MPYATYRFNKIIAAETIRFIVTVAIVVYKGLKLVVYRMLTIIIYKIKEANVELFNLDHFSLCVVNSRMLFLELDNF